MRINKYIAASTTLSRRAADTAIEQGRVMVNGQVPTQGHDVMAGDSVTLDGRPITPDVKTVTILLNKPRGYVVSRNGQGGDTVFDILPPEYRHLQPVGRLDKYSSGLLLLTNDGQLAQELTHPSHQKTKIYEIQLNQPLQPLHQQMINDMGVQLEDGRSQLQLAKLSEDRWQWQVTMHEGRNRQIRRTFAALGYNVSKLHRVQFGNYKLDGLAIGKIRLL